MEAASFDPPLSNIYKEASLVSSSLHCRCGAAVPVNGFIRKSFAHARLTVLLLAPVNTRLTVDWINLVEDVIQESNDIYRLND